MGIVYPEGTVFEGGFASYASNQQILALLEMTESQGR